MVSLIFVRILQIFKKVPLLSFQTHLTLEALGVERGVGVGGQTDPPALIFFLALKFC